MTVTLHPAAYDVAVMLAAMDKVSDKYGDDFHEASPSDDGSGIEIGQTADAARNGPSVEEWTRAAGVPVHTEITDPPEAAAG